MYYNIFDKTYSITDPVKHLQELEIYLEDINILRDEIIKEIEIMKEIIKKNNLK